MFDYQQRAATNEYREGWELIWGKKEKPEITGIDSGNADGDRSNVRDVSVEEINKMVDRHKASKNQCDGCNAGYPINENGLHVVPYPSGTMVCQKNKYSNVVKNLSNLQDILDDVGGGKHFNPKRINHELN